MGYSVYLALASLVSVASAGWQVQCFSRLYDQRVDPIVNPGGVSSHTHVIMGGSGFSPDMDYAKARASNCLTCNIREDLSNYWTPKLYFQGADGKFTNVPIQGDNQYGNMGGMAIYYNDHRYNNEMVHAFPENFRMLAGVSTKRAQTNDLAAQAVMMECVDAGGNVKYPGLPNTKCSLGIVAELVMPSCWDGVNVDSPDHKSHVSYPTNVIEGGQCPSSHPVRLMTMTYKVTYRTDVFKDMWPSDKNPFVFSNGDGTGYGFHGDFFNGWDTAVLEAAANNCSPTLVQNGNRCQAGYTGADKIFNFVTNQGEAYSCKPPITTSFDEPMNGVLDALPGCNPVSYGPDSAPRNPTCNGQALGASQPAGQSTTSSTTTSAVAQSTSSETSTTQTTQVNQGTPISSTSSTSASTTSSSSNSVAAKGGSTGFADMTSKGFSYIGCGSDDPAKRTFNDFWVAWPDMTIDKCIDFCLTKNYTYAGTEWSSECYCGNTLAADRAPKAGSSSKCVKPCNGDSSQICGGDRAMSIYKACSGGQCTNSPVSRIKRYIAAHRGYWSGNI